MLIKIEGKMYIVSNSVYRRVISMVEKSEISERKYSEKWNEAWEKEKKRMKETEEAEAAKEAEDNLILV